MPVGRLSGATARVGVRGSLPERCPLKGGADPQVFAERDAGGRGGDVLLARNGGGDEPLIKGQGLSSGLVVPSRGSPSRAGDRVGGDDVSPFPSLRHPGCEL